MTILSAVLSIVVSVLLLIGVLYLLYTSLGDPE